MIITDYDLCTDTSTEAEMITQLNNKRRILGEIPIKSINFYTAEFRSGHSYKVLECYPRGETPFLFTTDISVDKSVLGKIESYTGLNFKYTY